LPQIPLYPTVLNPQPIPRTQFPTSHQFSQNRTHQEETTATVEDFYRRPPPPPQSAGNRFTGFPPAIPPENPENPKDPDDLDDLPADDRRPTSSGYSRELSNITKIYIEGWKYGDGQDNFNLKLIIFRDICARVELPENAYKKALPIMLKGRALEYYYTGLIQKNLEFNQLCTAIEQHFEDANHRRNTLTEWNNLDLSTLKS
jgi:hypothetical protein